MTFLLFSQFGCLRQRNQYHRNRHGQLLVLRITDYFSKDDEKTRYPTHRQSLCYRISAGLTEFLWFCEINAKIAEYTTCRICLAIQI